MTLTQTPFLGHNLLYETRESGLRRSAGGSGRQGHRGSLGQHPQPAPPRRRALGAVVLPNAHSLLLLFLDYLKQITFIYFTLKYSSMYL